MYNLITLAFKTILRWTDHNLVLFYTFPSKILLHSNCEIQYFPHIPTFKHLHICSCQESFQNQGSFLGHFSHGDYLCLLVSSVFFEVHFKQIPVIRLSKCKLHTMILVDSGQTSGFLMTSFCPANVLNSIVISHDIRA